MINNEGVIICRPRRKRGEIGAAEPSRLACRSNDEKAHRSASRQLLLLALVTITVYSILNFTSLPVYF